MRFLRPQIMKRSLPLKEKSGFFSLVVNGQRITQKCGCLKKKKKENVHFSLQLLELSLPPWLGPPIHNKQRCLEGPAETFEEMFCRLVLCYEILSVATDTIRVAPEGKLGKYRKWVLWGQEVALWLFVRGTWELAAVSPLIVCVWERELGGCF